MRNRPDEPSVDALLHIAATKYNDDDDDNNNSFNLNYISSCLLWFLMYNILMIVNTLLNYIQIISPTSTTATQSTWSYFARA